MEVLIQFGIFIAFLALGFFVGGWTERSHLRRLTQREEAVRGFVSTQVKMYLQPKPGGKPPRLVVAEVVVASDYLKTFLAGLRNLFGGEVRSYQTLVDRARREAILKLIDEAQSHGYNAICNVRLNTADVGGMSRQGAAMAPILGWATAYESELGDPVPQPPANSDAF